MLYHRSFISSCLFLCSPLRCLVGPRQDCSVTTASFFESEREAKTNVEAVLFILWFEAKAIKKLHVSSTQFEARLCRNVFQWNSLFLIPHGFLDRQTLLILS